MPYRSGDYLQGGLLGALGKGLMKVGRTGLSLAGGPAATVAQAAGSVVFRKGSKTAPIGSSPVATPVSRMSRLGGMTKRALRGAAAFGSGMFPPPGPGLPMMGGGGGGGGGGFGRKHRRMHVTNVKALRRGIRRLQGFEKLARRVLRITSPGKAHKFGGFKKATRKR